ncbi:MAG: hypothetical protein ACO3JL_05785, partial [Myxococcota bacterium]
MRLVTGALESPDLVPEFDLSIVTTYTLAPGSWTLLVETTVRNDDSDDLTFEPGDALFVAQEVSERWAPAAGREPA